MFVKGCLKSVSAATKRDASSSSRPPCRRSVSFRGKDCDAIYTADDWDRSPVDITPKLTYDDMLELKELQVAAARACARAHAASGSSSSFTSSSRLLSNVPVGLLPLLPESPPPNSPSSPSSPVSSGSSYSQSSGGSPPMSPLGGGSRQVSFSARLAEACMCKVFSADSGTSPRQRGFICDFHSQGPRNHTQFTQTTAPPKSPLGHTSHIPSPPTTPPRPTIVSIPAPSLPRKARNFAFLPLLDTPANTPMTTPTTTPSTSGVSSPVLSPNASSAVLSSYTSSASSLCPGTSYGSYSNYEAYGGPGPSGYAGVGSSATLGLERKLGLVPEVDSASCSSSESEEDKDWPHDWPGTRRRAVGLHATRKSAAHSSFAYGSPSRATPLPPSPPAEDAPPFSSSPSSASKRSSPPSQRNNPYFPPLPSSPVSGPSQCTGPTSPKTSSRSMSGPAGPDAESKIPLGKPRLAALPSPVLIPPSPFSLYPPSPSSPTAASPGGPASPPLPSMSAPSLPSVEARAKRTEGKPQSAMDGNGPQTQSQIQAAASRKARFQMLALS